MSTALRKYVSSSSKIQLIYNWSILPDFNNLAPSKQGSKSSDIPIESSIKLLYSGNIGSSHELSTVLDSLHTLSVRDCQLFVLTSRHNQAKLSAKYSNLLALDI